MSRIPGIEPQDASPEVRAIYHKYQADGFPIFNVMKMFANKAEFVSALYELSRGLYTNGVLSPRYRELAYLRTSQINACHY
jgi:alkylhydroperoxidase family enzyme